MTGDPAVETWREAFAGSTSARLRRVEQDHAEAVETCTELAKELAVVSVRLFVAEKERDKARAELTEAQKPCAWRDLAVDAIRERDYARAQLDGLIAAHHSAEIHHSPQKRTEGEPS